MTFSRDELVAATSNFNAGNIIGKGGFGLVYRGKLRHTLVAVKVLSEVCYYIYHS